MRRVAPTAPLHPEAPHEPREPADTTSPVEPPARGRTRASHQARGTLCGVVRIRHLGRDYRAWYRVVGNLLTVYCGVASNTGVAPELLPSPTPLAERLLREMIENEHPGVVPEGPDG